MQVFAFEPAYAWIPILRASGIDGICVRQFIESDQDRALYKAILKPINSTLTTSLGHAQFIGNKPFGVVPYEAGFKIQVKSNDFEKVLTLLQPQKRDQFLCKTNEISGLQVAISKESLQQFLGD